MKRKHSAFGCILALLFLNGLIAARIFKTEFTPAMWSLEGAYFGLERWLTVHWSHLGWFPLWYGGIPVENAYPPLLHFLVAFTSVVTGMTIPHSWHVVTGALYCLGPVAMFGLVLRLTQSQWKAMTAASLYSLVSLSAFVFAMLRRDVSGGWGALGIYGLLHMDEGPNIASISLLMAALALIHRALDYKPGWRTVAAVLLSAAAALTNWLGAMSLVLGSLALLIARRRRQGESPASTHLVLIGLLAYSVASPWMPPSDIATVQKNAQTISGMFAMGTAQYALIAVWIIAAAALGLLLKRTSAVPEATCFAVVYLFLMALPPLAFEYFHIYPLPQPNRYRQEMDAAFAILAGIVLGSLGRRNWSRIALVAGLVCLAAFQIPHWRRQIRGWLPDFDVTRTVEYREARYLNAHFPGQRVFMTGTSRYWLNAFADNPQLAGGYDQGRSNPTIADVTYAIPYVRANGLDTIALLKAYGVRAIAVGGPKSRDVYKDYRDPGKFVGLVAEVWRDGDDVIYEIPGSGSLSHVVNPSDLVTTAALDYPAVTRYAVAIDAAPNARIVWTDLNRAHIQTSLTAPQVVSLQITFDKGWRASVNGVDVALGRDALGFLFLAPDCRGSCVIDLVYDGGVQAKLMNILCVAGLAVCGWIVYRERRFRR